MNKTTQIEIIEVMSANITMISDNIIMMDKQTQDTLRELAKSILSCSDANIKLAEGLKALEERVDGIEKGQKHTVSNRQANVRGLQIDG